MISSTLFGLVLMGYEVISVPACWDTQGTRYSAFTQHVEIYPEHKQIVIYQYAGCQDA